MKVAIGVMLSGNATVYAYALEEALMVNHAPGDRVVIANKLKEGDELSLSIGTYVGAMPGTAPDLLKPAVQFINSSFLQVAKIEMLRLEGKPA